MDTKHTILIVDDDPNLRKTLSDILGVKGYAPIAVATGQAALERVEEEPPAVALIDLRLEDMSGLEVTKEIKERCPGTECIVLTGHASQASAIEAVNLGAYSYVQKPYDVEQLLVMIRRAIEKREVEEALRESEERYRDLIESTYDMIQSVAPDGRFVFVNRAWLETLGYTEAELPSLNLWKIIHPESLLHCQKVFSRVMAGEPIRNVQATFVAKDGRSILVEGNATGRYIGGRLVATHGFFRDITERKRAEVALKEAQRYTRGLIEANLDALVTISAEGKISDVNRATELITGISREEIVGTDFSNYFTDPDAASKGYQQVFRDGYVRDYPLNVKHRDGKVTPVVYNASVYKDARGRVAGVFAAARDITERKRAEEALRESEKQLQSLTDAMPDFVCFKDEDGRWLKVNDACIRLFRLEGVDYRGKKDSELAELDSFLRGTLLTCQETDARAWENGSLSHKEEMIPHPDGTVRVYDVIKVPVFHPCGERKGLVVLGRDITERKQAEEERTRLLEQIREQAQQVQQIIDTMPEGVLLLDADGQAILANPVADKDLLVLADARVGDTLTHLGDRPLAELLARPPKGLWHKVEIDAPPPRTFEVIARPIEPAPPSSEPPLPPEDVETAADEIQNQKSKIANRAGWVLVIRDVTREREMQRYNQQQERLATVGQLAAGIAHDFNNIMATIILYAHTLSRRIPALSPGNRERLATIKQQAMHATNLIQQILDFSRRAALKRQPLDLVPLLKEQVKMLARTLPESIEIDLAYAPALSPSASLGINSAKGPDEFTVNADPTRIQQVVMNLAVNARDAMPEGGNLRFGLERIEIQPGESPPLPKMKAGAWVRVTVSDTGTGIPPDVLPHIFDPFFTTKGLGEGSGLGLAQVYGIVKQHEGEIDVHSQVGQGTTFTIYLPALPVHPPEAATLELPAPAQGQGETVLVVEDDAAMREALVDSLELLNYRVLAAANGQEALEIVERHGDKIALVLSDVVMPRMGGIALLHALKQRGLTVPVVMLTGHPLEKEMEELRAQGMSDWLFKPPSLEQLAKVVVRALKHET